MPSFNAVRTLRVAGGGLDGQHETSWPGGLQKRLKLQTGSFTGTGFYADSLTTTPESGSPTAGPKTGADYAVSDTSGGPGTAILSQTFTVKLAGSVPDSFLARQDRLIVQKTVKVAGQLFHRPITLMTAFYSVIAL
jgi:hypothetical protein